MTPNQRRVLNIVIRCAEEGCSVDRRYLVTCLRGRMRAREVDLAIAALCTSREIIEVSPHEYEYRAGMILDGDTP